MVARRGKCPKNHFFCIFGLLSYKYNLHQVGLEFRQLFDILVHPNQQVSIRDTYAPMLPMSVTQNYHSHHCHGTICAAQTFWCQQNILRLNICSQKFPGSQPTTREYERRGQSWLRMNLFLSRLLSSVCSDNSGLPCSQCSVQGQTL